VKVKTFTNTITSASRLKASNARDRVSAGGKNVCGTTVPASSAVSWPSQPLDFAGTGALAGPDAEGTAVAKSVVARAIRLAVMTGWIGSITGLKTTVATPAAGSTASTTPLPAALGTLATTVVSTLVLSLATCPSPLTAPAVAISTGVCGLLAPPVTAAPTAPPPLGPACVPPTVVAFTLAPAVAV
jgi:hypothetical protein